MTDLFGPVTRATLATGMWLVPVAPLAAAGYAACLRLSHAWRGAKATAPDAAAGVATLLGAAVALAASALFTLRLSRLEEGQRGLLEHVLRMVRLGQLDVALDLTLDGQSAALLLAVSAAALAGLAAMRARGAAAPTLGWASLLLGATDLAILADGLAVVIVAWGVASCAVLGLTRDVRAFAVSRVTDGLLLLGTVALFWGTGGAFHDGDYLPDLSPRFAAVAVRALSDRDDAAETAARNVPRDDDDDDARRDANTKGTAGSGLVTLTAYPGALVFMDDARTPMMRDGAPLRSPFTRALVPAGTHSFRVHPGDGLDDYLVSHVVLARDREVALALFGATVTFAQMQGQLAAKDARGEGGLRAALLGRSLTGGVPLLAAACLLVLAGAVARSGQPPLGAGFARLAAAPALTGALVAGTGAVLGVHLVLRLQFLTQLSAPVSAALALGGGGSAALGAWRASRAADLRGVALHLASAELGFALLGAGVGAPAAATLALAVAVLGGGATWACVAALEPTAGTDLRRMGGLTGPARGVARLWLVTGASSWLVSVPKLAVLLGAVHTRATGRLPGWVPCVLGAAALGLGAYAARRVHLRAFGGAASAGAEARAAAPATVPSLAWLLAGLAAVLGVVLGVGGAFVGKGGLSAMDEWLADVTAGGSVPATPPSAGLAIGLLLVALGVANFGWLVAGARYGAGKPRLAEAADVAAPATPPRLPPAPALARAALGLERWVLDGAQAALGAAVTAASLFVATADDRLGAGVDALADRTARKGPRARATLATGLLSLLALALYLALRHAP